MRRLQIKILGQSFKVAPPNISNFNPHNAPDTLNWGFQRTPQNILHKNVHTDRIFALRIFARVEQI